MNDSVHRPRGRIRARVPGFGALVVLFGLIGAVRAAPQTESPATSAVFFPERDRNLAPRLLGLLQPGQREGWERGFDLAQRLGSAGLPVLLDLAEQEEADVRRRVLLLGAAAVGSGPAADSGLVALGARARAGSAGVQERFALGLTLALGEARSAELPGLRDLASRRGLEPIEVAALLAASARFPSEAEVQARWFQDEDPAVVAMALWASPPPDVRMAQAWWARERRHGGLVRRSCLLGPTGRGGDGGTTGAWIRTALAARGDEARALHDAAVLFLAEHEDPEDWLGREELAWVEDLVPVLSISPAWRRALSARGLLGLAPARLPIEDRCRQATAFALAADLTEFQAVAPGLGRDLAVVPSLCLALALRFCAAPPEDVEAWLVELPDVREAEWIRLACGLPAASPGRSMADARLDRVFLLAARSPGSLPRDVLAAEIEDALWRSGAHFGHVRRSLELDLVRDALLAGSAHGAAVLGLGTDPRNRHLPRGLSDGSPVFEIGYELYRAFRAPGLRRPAAVRPLQPTAPR